MNKIFIDGIVEEILHQIPYTFIITKSDVEMVKLAFLNGTRMYSNDSRLPNTYGMMAMSEDKVLEVIHDMIKPQFEINDYVFRATMVDCDSFDTEDILAAADYNIGFQVILTYLYLFNKNGAKPENLDDAITIYIDKWGLQKKKTKNQLGKLLAEHSRG